VTQLQQTSIKIKVTHLESGWGDESDAASCF